MQDFLDDLQALCDRHNCKLGAGIVRPAGAIPGERYPVAKLIAHRLDDSGICVETAYPDPITPARRAKGPNPKGPETRPVFGERADR